MNRAQKIATGVWALFGAGFMLGALTQHAVTRAMVAKNDVEREKIWTAVGVVNERISNGTYQGTLEERTEQAMNDLAFERIRLMEEHLSENSR